MHIYHCQLFAEALLPGSPEAQQAVSTVARRMKALAWNQCSGSMTFWCGSGSGDPCLWLVDLDPDPAIFVIDLQDASKKLIFSTIFSACYFLKVHLHYFSKIKVKKSHKIVGFSYYFCMMIEGSGSIPLTSGSESGRPKNTWIRWIRNTAWNSVRTSASRLRRLARA